MAMTRHGGRGWALIIAVLSSELVGVLWVALNSLRGVIADSSNPQLEEFRGAVVAQGTGIFILLVFAFVWVGITLLGALRQRPWARASHLTLQVLVIAAGTGVLQGILGTVAVGVGLLILGSAGVLGTWLSRPRAENPSG